MKLWSIQEKNVVDVLNKGYTFTCDPGKSLHVQEDGFRVPYDWLSKQMLKRVPEQLDDSTLYPVWAWNMYDGKTRLDKRISYIRNLPENCYVVHLDIDDERVLLSDFDNWHFVLNNLAYRADDYEGIDLDWSDSLTLAEKEETWENIFDVSRSLTIQATFWELRPEDVVKIEKLS